VGTERPDVDRLDHRRQAPVGGCFGHSQRLRSRRASALSGLQVCHLTFTSTRAGHSEYVILDRGGGVGSLSRKNAHHIAERPLMATARVR
jgi:hypothetical protein